MPVPRLPRHDGAVAPGHHNAVAARRDVRVGGARGDHHDRGGAIRVICLLQRFEKPVPMVRSLAFQPYAQRDGRIMAQVTDRLHDRSPWIKAVRIDAVDPLLSHWTLNTYGMTLNWKARKWSREQMQAENIIFKKKAGKEWLTRDATGMTTIEPGARIAWKAEEGLPNRGRVLFTREADDDSRTSVTLAIEFDVPSAVAFAFRSTFVASLVERTLLEDLKRFRDVALGKKRSRVRAGLDVPRRAGPAVQIAIERLAERPA